MSREEPLVTAQTPTTGCADSHLEGFDAVDEQERWPMRQYRFRKGEHFAHFPNASSRNAGVSLGEILYHA